MRLRPPSAAKTNRGGFPNEEIRPGLFFLPASGVFAFVAVVLRRFRKRAGAGASTLRRKPRGAMLYGRLFALCGNIVRTLPGVRARLAVRHGLVCAAQNFSL